METDQIIYSKNGLIEKFNGAIYTKTSNEDIYNQAEGSTLKSSKLTGIANSSKSIGFSNLVDWFGREANKTFTINCNDFTVSLEKEYNYKNGTNSNTTTRYIEEISNNVKINDSVKSSESFSYTYDMHGNVKTVSVCSNDAITLQYEYYYDEANQIVRVDDYINNITTTYQYDMGGNVVSVKGFNRETYSTESIAISEDVYVYDNIWKDKLSSINGKIMTYDSIGNLLTYNGKSHIWVAGRQLSSFQNSDYTLSFLYDENGLRSKKTIVNDGATKTISYIWVHDKLVGQTDETDTLYFVYDESEEIIGFIKNNSDTYLYIKNLFGDIVGILDETGSVVVKYDYDVWGKLISISGPLSDTIGQLNPIRYRGYYYDCESGYYYLQNRYYDPELKRFINADKLEDIYSPKNTYFYADSVNVFAYCSNSPINMVDFKGEKESNNTAAYVSNAFVFFVVLGSCRDSLIKIASDQALYSRKSASTYIYKNSQKGCMKINLEIKLNDGKSRFINILYLYYKLLGDVVFELLTDFALLKFEETFPKAHIYYYPKKATAKRPFLFSDDCVEREIKDHCMGYWYSVGKIKDSSQIRTFMKAYSIFSVNDLKKHCKVIDIAEQDACDPIDRNLFDYFNGIRTDYMNTKADPYWYNNGKRKKNNVRNDWKKTMIPTYMLSEV